MEFKQLKECIITELEELQASDIKEIDVYGRTSVTDLLVICSGRSTRHVKAIASKLIEKLKHVGQPPISTSGLDTGDWALLDCGDIIVHVMTNEIRAFYNLEALWRDDAKGHQSEQKAQ